MGGTKRQQQKGGTKRNQKITQGQNKARKPNIKRGGKCTKQKRKKEEIIGKINKHRGTKHTKNTQSTKDVLEQKI